MFQAWKNMTWPHFAHKQPRLICFTLVGWQGTRKASTVCSGVGKVVWAQPDTLEPPIITVIPIPPIEALAPRKPPTPLVSPAPQAKTQTTGYREDPLPHGELTKSASFLSSPYWASLCKSFNIIGPQFPHL